MVELSGQAGDGATAQSKAALSAADISAKMIEAQVSHLLAEWEDSDELAGEFAKRLLAFIRHRLTKIAKTEC